jgi:hypothetical protein
LATLVAQGRYGQNELTGKKLSYVLAQKTLREWWISRFAELIKQL